MKEVWDFLDKNCGFYHPKGSKVVYTWGFDAVGGIMGEFGISEETARNLVQEWLWRQ